MRGNDYLMKELALKVFRQPPDRLNCAQSVLCAWREVFGETQTTVADLKPLGAGRAPDGLCGAVYAACLLAPNRAEELKALLTARLGSLRCKEIRAAKKHSCAECVAEAAELLGGEDGSSRLAMETPDSMAGASNAPEESCDPN